MEEKSKNKCPVEEALKIIGGKWRLQIINAIHHDTQRFGALKRLIPNISEKMLIQELKHLASFGIVDRNAFPEIPPRVEYSLTPLGLKTLTIINYIKEFGEEILENQID